MIGCRGEHNTKYRENGMWNEWINSNIFLRGIQNCDFEMGNIYDSTIKMELTKKQICFDWKEERWEE